jgi:hypothetical protein
MRKSSEDVDILFTERLLKGAREGKMDEVTYSLDNGIDVESENEVRLDDSFDIII